MTAVRPVRPVRPVRRLTLALVLGALSVACGGGDDGGDDGVPAAAPEPAGEVVASELLYLGSARDRSPGSGGPGLLVDDVDLTAYLVGLAADVTAGCDEPTGAEVVVSGTDLKVVPTGVAEPDDVLCEAFAPAVAVVAIPRDEVPAGATIAGEPLSAPVGIGIVREVIRVGVEPRGGAVEVRTPDDLDALLRRWPDAPDAPPDVAPLDAGDRRMAATVSGCRPAGAEVVVTADVLRVVGRQEDHERGEPVECDQAEQVVVVVDVPADLTEDLALEPS